LPLDFIVGPGMSGLVGTILDTRSLKGTVPGTVPYIRQFYRPVGTGTLLQVYLNFYRIAPGMRKVQYVIFIEEYRHFIPLLFTVSCCTC